MTKIFVSVATSLCFYAMLQGCSDNQPWFDKYGDLLCTKFEEREVVLKSIRDQESLEANAQRYLAWHTQYDELESAMYSHSWKKNDSSLKLDMAKIAILAKRWQASKEVVDDELKRLATFAQRGENKTVNEFLHRVLTDYRNPFVMR